MSSRKLLLALLHCMCWGKVNVCFYLLILFVLQLSDFVIWFSFQSKTLKYKMCYCKWETQPYIRHLQVSVIYTEAFQGFLVRIFKLQYVFVFQRSGHRLSLALVLSLFISCLSFCDVNFANMIMRPLSVCIFDGHMYQGQRSRRFLPHIVCNKSPA